MARARTLVLNTKVNVTGADQLRGLGQTLQRTGTALSVGITAPLTLLAGVASRAASDLNESFNAVNVTFGETADAINLIGESSAESFGLSQRAFNQVATQFSSFAETVAGEGGDIAGVIKDLTQRGADFASVYNLEVSDALALFQSGLAGETEGLRRFGIDLSAAAVEAHAMAVGIGDGVGALTEAEKVQARYSLLLEETSKVQGDFANTAGEVANQQRIAAAAAEDAAAALGQKFLPVQQKVIEILSDAIDAWNKLPAPMQDAIIIFGVAAAALGPLLIALGSLLRLVGFLGGAKAIGGIKLLGLAFKGLLGPIGLAVAAGELLNTGLANLNRTMEGAPGALQRLGDALGTDVQQIAEAAKAVADETGESIESIVIDLDRLVGAGVGFEDSLRAVARGMDAVEWEKHQAAILESGEAWERYQEQTTGAMYGPEGVVPTIESAVDDMATEIGTAPGRMADELLAAQFRLTDATAELVRFMDEALSPAQEIFQLQGFLASGELAAGLVSNNPLIRKKAEEMQQAAIDRIAEIRGSFFNSGYSSASSYASGFDAASRDPALLNWIAGSASRLAAAARGIFPSSEPKDPSSPFRGITKGFGFGDILAKGLLTGSGAVAGAFRGLVGDGLTMPAVSGGLASASVGGGGTTVNNFYLQWDGEPPKGRSEAEIIATLQRLIPMVDTLKPVY